VRADEYFCGEWIDELPRLRRMLARHGVPADEVDDVVQETAIRLYSAWDRLFDGRPLRPLVTTIALNVARDYHRRSSHWARPVAAVPDDVLVDSHGVDSAVLARLEVARTARALSTLSPGHRRTVLEAVADDLQAEEAGRTRAPAATRMARTRARRHLAAALELIAGVTGVGVAVARRPLSSPAVSGGAAVAVGALALSAALVVHPGSADSKAATTDGAGMASRVTTTSAPGAAARPAVTHLVVYGSGSWQLSGSSLWWPKGGLPLLSADAFGRHAQVGDWGTGDACRVTVADRVEFSLRCRSVA
jgi:DNA-directed RNA polymerase specialized sigma24 family protein